MNLFIITLFINHLATFVSIDIYVVFFNYIIHHNKQIYDNMLFINFQIISKLFMQNSFNHIQII